LLKYVLFLTLRAEKPGRKLSAGGRLMPVLYEHLNPMPFEAAVQMELELAEDLRTGGYTVTGRH
jgi:hypothetical protein